MKKGIILGAVMSLLMATNAFAMPTFNTLTFNGMPSVTGNAGQVVQATLSFTNNPGDEVESLSYQYTSLGTDRVVVDITDQTLEGYHSVNFPMTLPVYGGQGAVPVEFKTFGIAGNGVDNLANTIATNNITFMSQIHVSATTTVAPAPTTTPVLSQLDQLMALLMQLLAKPVGVGTVTPPTETSVCVKLSTYADLSEGDRGSRVTGLQKLLIKNGARIPAIQSGAAKYGYYGQQTTDAYFEVAEENECG